MDAKSPKFGAEGAVLENFRNIFEKLRNNWKIGNKKRKIGHIWLFRGVAGTSKFFGPLSTRYFGILVAQTSREALKEAVSFIEQKGGR